MIDEYDKRVLFVFATFTFACLMLAVPLHEGFHSLACEIQGGTAITTWDMTYCNWHGQGDIHKSENYAAAPYMASFFFFGVSFSSLGSFVSFVKIC